MLFFIDSFTPKKEIEVASPEKNHLPLKGKFERNILDTHSSRNSLDIQCSSNSLDFHYSSNSLRGWVKATYINMHIKLDLKIRVILILSILLLNLNQIACKGKKLFSHIADFCMNELSFQYATKWLHEKRVFNEFKRCKESAWCKGMRYKCTNKFNIR